MPVVNILLQIANKYVCRITAVKYGYFRSNNHFNKLYQKNPDSYFTYMYMNSNIHKNKRFIGPISLTNAFRSSFDHILESQTVI